MNISAKVTDERVLDVRFDDASLIVDLMDGRTISVPLAWYPRLLHAMPEQRARWEMAGAGFGIHWPDLDEDLSTEGLLRGSPAAQRAARARRGCRRSSGRGPTSPTPRTRFCGFSGITSHRLGRVWSEAFVMRHCGTCYGG